jgi:hypothetical protein
MITISFETPEDAIFDDFGVIDRFQRIFNVRHESDSSPVLNIALLFQEYAIGIESLDKPLPEDDEMPTSDKKRMNVHIQYYLNAGLKWCVDAQKRQSSGDLAGAR